MDEKKPEESRNNEREKSTQESIDNGRKATEAAKSTAPQKESAGEDAQKKDAEQWRNEG